MLRRDTFAICAFLLAGITTTPATAGPCATARGLEHALTEAAAGPEGYVGGLKPSELPSGTARLESSLKILRDEAAEVAFDVLKEKEIFVDGIQAKVRDINSARRSAIDKHYQDYRSKAQQESITPELRNHYAKEIVGPLFNRIEGDESTWLKRREDTKPSNVGWMHAYIELVEIERQERESLTSHPEQERLCLHTWAQDRSKYTADNYQGPAWSETKEKCLANYKKSFYESPQYLEAERLKKLLESIEATKEASSECEKSKLSALERAQRDAAERKRKLALERAQQDALARKQQEALAHAKAEAAARERERQQAAEQERRRQIAAAQERERQRAAAAAEQASNDDPGVAGALLGILKTYSEIQAAKSRQGSGMTWSAPPTRDACTPGPNFDGSACECLRNPRGVGCGKGTAR